MIAVPLHKCCCCYRLVPPHPSMLHRLAHFSISFRTSRSVIDFAQPCPTNHAQKSALGFRFGIYVQSGLIDLRCGTAARSPQLYTAWDGTKAGWPPQARGVFSANAANDTADCLLGHAIVHNYASGLWCFSASMINPDRSLATGRVLLLTTARHFYANACRFVVPSSE